MIYYKVCYFTPKHIYSYNFRPTLDHTKFGLSLEYKIGEWTYPIIPNSRLYCFKFIDDAYHFRNLNNTDNFVYKCEVKNPARLIKYIGSVADPEKAVKFWKSKKNKEHCIWENIPQGTYTASAIKLIERV
jgi:hypothetical protein